MEAIENSKHHCNSILIVEDDTSLRVLIAEVLENEGYSVNQAENGQEALNLLETIKKPCLVLLDMMMPIMNGAAFLNKLTENVHLATIPVLVVSAVSNESETKGAIGYMKKPVDIESLLKVVSQYCGEPKN